MPRLRTAIAGSFKFKAEIDALHEEFADYGVEVLEPTKGWLYIPSRSPVVREAFRPLPAERYMADIKLIEDRFLTAIRNSHFLYLYNPGEYLGTSASFEVGYALANGTTVFAREPVSLVNVEYELDTWEFLKTSIQVATPEEASRSVIERNVR